MALHKSACTDGIKYAVNFSDELSFIKWNVVQVRGDQSSSKPETKCFI